MPFPHSNITQPLTPFATTGPLLRTSGDRSEQDKGESQSQLPTSSLKSATYLFFLAFLVASASMQYLLHSQVRSIQRDLLNLSRDGIGLQDFASRYNGARIMLSLTTLVTQPGSDPINGPFLAIDDDLRPGRCWPTGGHSGQIGVQFPQPVKVSHITIDHIAKEVALDLTAAPREILVWGYTSEGANTLFPGDNFALLVAGRAKPYKSAPGLFFIPIAKFQYDIYGPDNIQTFPLMDEVMAANIAFDGIVVEVLNNWGGKTTCLYRVRAHSLLA